MTSHPSASSSWAFRNQVDPHSHSHPHPHQLPTPASPRLHPKQPGILRNSTRKVFQSVFGRQPSRSSANSVHSSQSGGGAPLVDINVPLFVPMPPAPVVSPHESADDEQECPVCLEPLSFSFRLPGEKPHVVPECGHSLHEVSSLLPSASPPLLCDPALTHPGLASRLVLLLYTALPQVSPALPSPADRTWASVAYAGAP